MNFVTLVLRCIYNKNNWNNFNKLKSKEENTEKQRQNHIYVFIISNLFSIYNSKAIEKNKLMNAYRLCDKKTDR